MPVFFLFFVLIFFCWKEGGGAGMNMTTILSKSIDYQTTKNPLQSLCDNKEQK